MRRFRGRVSRGGGGGGAARKDPGESDKKKKEEWLGVVRNASLVLTSLTPLPHDTDSSAAGLSQTHTEASLAASLPAHPASRLVVVTGLPTHLSVTETRERLRRVCRPHGGLHNDQLYLPVRESSRGKEREGEQSRSSSAEDTPSSAPKTTENLSSSEQVPPDTSAEELAGHAVLELNCSGNTSAVCDSILNLPFFQRGSRGEGEGSGETHLAVSAVSNSLTVGEDEAGGKALEEYLRLSLLERGGDGAEILVSSAGEVLKCVFESGKKEGDDSKEEGGTSLGGELSLFLAGFGGGRGSGKETGDAVWREIESGSKRRRGEGAGVSCEEFLSWCGVQAGRGPRLVWLGLFACGYDLHFTR